VLNPEGISSWSSSGNIDARTSPNGLSVDTLKTRLGETCHTELPVIIIELQLIRKDRQVFLFNSILEHIAPSIRSCDNSQLMFSPRREIKKMANLQP
jgi:hypothetical protein